MAQHNFLMYAYGKILPVKCIVTMETKMVDAKKVEKEGAQVAVAGAQATTRFVVIHGDKGGVGKSFVAQALADFLCGRKVPVAIIDADTQNPDVFRMFSGSLPTAQANIRSENGWMDLMDFVAANQGCTIIMNTPAGIGEYMKDDLVSFSNFLKSQDIPIEMEMFWVMNANHDSVNLFGKAMEKYGQYFSKIRVVCNLHFSGGNVDAFILWAESELRTRIEKAGGLTIYFPGLHIRVVTKVINPEKVIPFSDAADEALGENLRFERSERFKLQDWLSTIADRFAPAFPLLVGKDKGAK